MAEALGYNSLILSSAIEGNTREATALHVPVAPEIRPTGNPVAPPAVIICGGESIVEVTGGGLGGRNQHFALCLARKAARIKEAVFTFAAIDALTAQLMQQEQVCIASPSSVPRP